MSEKLLNIQVVSNNRDNNLFKFFLNSLGYIKSLNKIASITINYNGGITNDAVVKSNNIIQNLGFELHWTYNNYKFEKGKHKILKIRYDCDKVDGVHTPYILLLDDDVEFLPGYDRQVLIALNFLQSNPKAGIVSFFDCAPYTIKKQDTLYPVDMRYAFSLYGGILTRRINKWGGLYPKECIDLYGAGEEQLQGIEILRLGLQGYTLNAKCYFHEQHWGQNTCICGQGTYQWVWNRQDKHSIMGYIASVESVEWLHDKVWTGEKYWEDPSNIYSYETISSRKLFTNLIN